MPEQNAPFTDTTASNLTTPSLVPVNNSHTGLLVTIIIILALLVLSLVGVVVILGIQRNSSNMTNINPTSTVIPTITPTGNLENFPIISIVDTHACTFSNNTTDGYGINQVTTAEKNQICEFYRARWGTTIYPTDSALATWYQISIAGKEGNHILIGVVDSPCLVEIGTNQVKELWCRGDIPPCDSVDGLAVTHLIPTCEDTTKSTATERSTI